jgi:hypothetical protein
VYQKLLSHNDDLQRLVDKGYAVDFDSNYLIVRDIPYLDEHKALQWGTIVSKLEFNNDCHVKQDNHQIYFSGSIPCGSDGKHIPNLGNQSSSLPLSDNNKDVVVQRSFSNKPAHGYTDFYEKIDTYVTIISGPAMEIFKEATPYTFKIPKKIDEETVFLFPDTLTSIAGINDLSAKFKDEVVAIIGLGGTGSYILDFLVRTPVKEIRLFDFDEYYVHNTYRSPGMITKEELGKSKIYVYKSRYDPFRKNIIGYEKQVDTSCRQEIEGVTFAFVCVDKGEARANIISLLTSMEIPFIDTGIGIDRTGTGCLRGMVRTTYFSTNPELIKKNKEEVSLKDGINDMYKTNIQIGEINALNACLAVIRYKQLRGFYNEANYGIINSNLLLDITDIRIAGDEIENK